MNWIAVALSLVCLAVYTWLMSIFLHRSLQQNLKKTTAELTTERKKQKRDKENFEICQKEIDSYKKSLLAVVARDILMQWLSILTNSPNIINIHTARITSEIQLITEVIPYKSVAELLGEIDRAAANLKMAITEIDPHRKLPEYKLFILAEHLLEQARITILANFIDERQFFNFQDLESAKQEWRRQISMYREQWNIVTI